MKLHIVKTCLELKDRTLFAKLKTQKISLSQAYARMAPKKHGITYTVVDDIKDEIREDILNGFGSEE